MGKGNTQGKESSQKSQEEEMIHIYIRAADTGRFVTHFLYPLEKWKMFETIATFKGISPDEAFKQAIVEYAEMVLSHK